MIPDGGLTDLEPELTSRLDYGSVVYRSLNCVWRDVNALTCINRVRPSVRVPMIVWRTGWDL
jgi:hypothetical protein